MCSGNETLVANFEWVGGWMSEWNDPMLNYFPGTLMSKRARRHAKEVLCA